MLRAQTACGDPDAAATSGLVAYVDDEPAGWVAVEPRTAYPEAAHLSRPVDRPGRGQGRRRRLGGDLLRGPQGLPGPRPHLSARPGHVDFARERGARALEAYPMITQPGKEITWGELHVGARQVFEDAGFEEVSHPTLRRVVMRIDFG